MPLDELQQGDELVLDNGACLTVLAVVGEVAVLGITSSPPAMDDAQEPVLSRGAIRAEPSVN